MSTGFPDHPFWDFSLTVYGTDGVPPACLALQERYGVDVNLLLWCLWLGQSGAGALRPNALEAAAGRIHGWHQSVVRHLRDVRQRLKTPDPAVNPDLQQSLRARIQKIEIDAEHIEQLALAAEAERPGLAIATDQPLRDALSNAAAYLSALNAVGDSDDARHLAQIAAAAFPAEAPSAVRAATEAALNQVS